MGTVSVSMPDELQKKMARLEEINWSAVARRAFEEQVRDIEFLKSIANKSSLTEKDAKEISDTINKAVGRRFREMKR